MDWLRGGSQYAGAFPGEMLSNLPHVAWRNYQTATPTLRCQYDHGRIYVNYFKIKPVIEDICPDCGGKMGLIECGDEETKKFWDEWGCQEEECVQNNISVHIMDAAGPGLPLKVAFCPFCGKNLHVDLLEDTK